MGARAQGICPAERPIIVLHCGNSTVIRCGGHDYTCPQAKVKVVTKMVVKVVKVKPKHKGQSHNPLGFLFHH